MHTLYHLFDFPIEDLNEMCHLRLLVKKLFIQLSYEFAIAMPGYWPASTSIQSVLEPICLGDE